MWHQKVESGTRPTLPQYKYHTCLAQSNLFTLVFPFSSSHHFLFHFREYRIIINRTYSPGFCEDNASLCKHSYFTTASNGPVCEWCGQVVIISIPRRHALPAPTLLRPIRRYEYAQRLQCAIFQRLLVEVSCYSPIQTECNPFSVTPPFPPKKSKLAASPITSTRPVGLLDKCSHSRFFVDR